MSTYKNVCGEKAYIAHISSGLADIALVNEYQDLKHIFEKLNRSNGLNMKYSNIQAEINYLGKGYQEDGSRKAEISYTILIVNVPVKDALNLPDWKD